MGNLKGLLCASEIWKLRHSDDKPQAALPNGNGITNAATAADRAAGGGRSPLQYAASPSSLAVSSILSPSPSKAPNFAEAAVDALAAAKRAEASRLVVERLAEQRLAAERMLSERGQTEDVAAERMTRECYEGERLSAARLAAVAENESMMADRLMRCEQRE